MKESIHKYFKVGTIQWMSFPNSAPLDSLLAIARDDYFDAVELTGYGDKHPRFGYPNGANDVAEMLDFLRVLKEEGFFDAENPYVLSAEVTLRPGEDEGIVLANTKRVLNRAWALLED